MKKVIYSGKEEGIFVFGTFANFMKEKSITGYQGVGRNEPPETSLNLSWLARENIRIDYLYRSLDIEGPITVLATGEEEKIGDFERIILEEDKKIREKK